LSLGTCGPTLFYHDLYDCNLKCLSYVYMGKIKHVLTKSVANSRIDRNLIKRYPHQYQSIYIVHT